MSDFICCRPPRVPDGLSSPQYWRCPICGQWWECWEEESLKPTRVSKIGMAVNHYSEWRHWHKFNRKMYSQPPEGVMR